MNVYRIVPALPAWRAPVGRAVRIEAGHGIERDGASILIFDPLPGLRPILRKPGRHAPVRRRRAARPFTRRFFLRRGTDEAGRVLRLSKNTTQVASGAVHSFRRSVPKACG